ncbi:PAS domain-containing protein [Phreatobacter sp.]|uniref:PAS domain-containing protein n=1 Tax=Phreatobacter sp. TaxID=1966341 RepID=UPI003F70C1D1
MTAVQSIPTPVPPRSDGWSSFHALGMVEELAGAGTMTADLVTGLHRWSWGIYRILGAVPDGLQPSFQAFDAFVHPDDRVTEEAWRQEMTDGLPVTRTFRIVRRNGAVRWVTCRAEIVRREGSRPVVMAAALVDVTVAHDAQRAREISEHRRDALTRVMAAMVWTTCPDGRATGSLPWQALTGQSAEAAADFGWLDMVHPEDRDRVRQAWLEAIGRRIAIDATYRLKLADGRYGWQHARTAPVLDREGVLREWAGVGHPIDPGDVLTRREREPGVETVVSRTPPAPLSGAMIRAARALVGWSVADLAAASGVSVSTLRRIEETDETQPRRAAAVDAMQRALEGAGVQFAWRVDGEAYLRLSQRPAG